MTGKQMMAKMSKTHEKELSKAKEANMPALGTGQRFKDLTEKLATKGAKDPKALAAYIGRKKYGAGKMTAMAKAGKK